MKLTAEQFATLRAMGPPGSQEHKLMMDKYENDDRFVYQRIGDRRTFSHPELGFFTLRPTDRLAQLLDGLH